MPQPPHPLLVKGQNRDTKTARWVITVLTPLTSLFDPTQPRSFLFADFTCSLPVHSNRRWTLAAHRW